MVNAQEWLDQEYPLSERNKLTQLNIDEKKLTGELTMFGFTNLTRLECYRNQLTNLDLSPCAGLNLLNCRDNKLINLDLSACSSLTKLTCSGNQLTTLDLSPCAGLTKLFCSWNQLTNLDLSPCAGLNLLNCYNNQLTKLNISSCSSLTEIHCRDNKLINLDLSACSSLTILYCSENQLINLNISSCSSLTEIHCRDNKLTNLNLINSLWLKQLICNDNQLTDIILPADAEKLVLERVDISNNEQLNYAAIESRFLKPLPVLTTSEIAAIDKEELAKIIKDKANIKGIKDIHYFSPWWNPNCALVTNKVVWRAIHLVIYEPLIEGKEKDEWGRDTEKTETKSPEVFKVFKVTGELESLTKIQAQTKLEELKAQLNSDHPITVLYPHHRGFSPQEVMQITKLPREVKWDPDSYLKSADMVWRNMDSMPTLMPDCYHVAVYLGNKRVAHIGSSKFAKVSKIKENKSLLGARNDHWLDFLQDTHDSLYVYHPIIPFQKPEKIQEHLTKAIFAEYGALNYSFLGNNCEHFATLAVCGIPFSTQADKIKMLTNYVYLNLAREIEKSEQAFAEMSNTETFHRETRRAELNQAIAALRAKEELTESEQEELTKWEKEAQESQAALQAALQVQFSWEQRINKIKIPGVVIKVIPFEKQNQVIVINKVAFYAVRLYEYNSTTKELTELKRFAKNKLGYTTLTDALEKVKRIIANEENDNHSDTESLQTISQIEIPLNN